MKRLLALLALLSCLEVQATTFEMDRTYSLKLFETQKACEDAQKNSPRWFNCSQTITLFKGGQARVMVTDIMNTATYVIVDHQITVTLAGRGDAPKVMRFSLTRNKRNLVDENLQVWEWYESNN